MQLQMQDTNRETTTNPTSGSRKWTDLVDAMRINPEVDAMADAMQEEVWRSVHSRIRRQGRWMRIGRWAAAAVVMAGVVCGSWMLGGLRTERQLVASALPVSVSTPLGVKSEVVLPDGSYVQLNGGTRIVYPAIFGRERRVTVEGEAYFEVVHDESKPFIVTTGSIVSTVLGTTFNVHAYPEDDDSRITLATGALRVDGGPGSRSVVLKPGEQGFFNRRSGLLTLRTVNVEQELSWREDKLYFRAEPLESIVRTLERQFNVDIVISDQALRGVRFTGEFVDGENIHEIMRIISSDSRILYRNYRNHFELYRNR